MTVARACPKVTLTVAWRALLLVVAGASVGVIVNLLHPKGVKVGSLRTKHSTVLFDIAKNVRFPFLLF